MSVGRLRAYDFNTFNLSEKKDETLPNGYIQYNPELDIVAMNDQLECFKFKYLPMKTNAQPGDSAGADKRHR